jgi:hypothetical protein
MEFVNMLLQEVQYCLYSIYTECIINIVIFILSIYFKFDDFGKNNIFIFHNIIRTMHWTNYLVLCLIF